MGRQRADDKACRGIELDSSELGYLFYVDESLGLIKPLLHEDRHMGTPGEDLGFAAVLLEQRAGFSDSRRFEVVEVSHLTSLAFKVQGSTFNAARIRH